MIGHGGFGLVFRCHQDMLDRTVSVKVLTADLDEDCDRFLRKQRAMGRLTGYPNIVGVLQVGQTEGGLPYLVMQYHQHGSLEDQTETCWSATPKRNPAAGGEDGGRVAGSAPARHPAP